MIFIFIVIAFFIIIAIWVNWLAGGIDPDEDIPDRKQKVAPAEPASQEGPRQDNTPYGVAVYNIIKMLFGG